MLRDKNTDSDGLCDDERIYYLGDANFNVTTLVNTGGDALERYVYSPYGVLTIYDATWASLRSTSSYANAYTYTGRQLDAETGLYYYRARLMHAQLGRFCSRDPIWYRAGVNLIEYVWNAPINRVDPEGKQPFPFPPSFTPIPGFPEPVTSPTVPKGDIPGDIENDLPDECIFEAYGSPPPPQEPRTSAYCPKIHRSRNCWRSVTL